jgi:hypothetical protein
VIPDPYPDTETMRYVSPWGGSVQFLIRAGVLGRLMPPVAIFEDPSPGGPGGRYYASRHLTRPLEVPVVAPPYFAGREELREWARVLDPRRGPGQLVVERGQFAGRWLRCIYEAGLDVVREDGTSPQLLGTLLFRAMEPYWQDGETMRLQVSLLGQVEEWFPIFPLVLGRSTAQGQFDAWNLGDVECWPVFTIRGPGSDIRLTNRTTGRLIASTSLQLSAAQFLQIDTRVGHKTALLYEGATIIDVFGQLTDDTEFWPLVEGLNDIHLDLGLATAQTEILAEYTQQYLAP